MATATAPAKQVKKHPWEPKRQFAFDLTKPLMKGPLLKQGGFHKAFKERYFILYPGFLVYYNDEITWKTDLQRGETLGSRISAMKLKGGSVEKARNPPKGAKYAFTVHSPDPSNKRSEVMFNCHSNEERYQWMTKIHSAIPKSAQPKDTTPPKDATPPKDTTPPKDDTTTDTTPPTEEETPQTEEEKEIPAESPTEENCVADIASEATEEEVFGPKDITDANSESDSEILEKDNVVSVSINVNGKESKNSSLSSADDNVDEVMTPEDDKTFMEMEATEVTIAPTDHTKMSIAVVDSGSVDSDTDSDNESSEDDVPLPETPSSTGGEATSRPSITIEDTESQRQPEAKQKDESSVPNEDPLLGDNRASPTNDKRRPSGAIPFIEKTGYLYKCGGKHKTWHQRYFLLQPGMFTYYKKKGGKQLGEVKLKSLKIIMPYPGEKTYSSYQFTIHTESQWNRRNDYVIAAPSDKDMESWIAAFKMASGTVRMSPDAETEPKQS